MVITSRSGYATPTERADAFKAITFTTHDLKGVDPYTGSLKDTYYYVMRELIPKLG